jgi:hypothetical protein
MTLCQWQWRKLGGLATSTGTDLCIGHSKILFKVAFEMSSSSSMALRGTLAFHSSIAALLSSWLKRFLFLF